MFSVLVDSVCTNSCGCCSTQLIETVSAVDKDEMVHRQYFHFSIAPEAVNNQNFSLKDNRGGWAQTFPSMRRATSVWTLLLSL